MTRRKRSDLLAFSSPNMSTCTLYAKFSATIEAAESQPVRNTSSLQSRTKIAPYPLKGLAIKVIWSKPTGWITNESKFSVQPLSWRLCDWMVRSVHSAESALSYPYHMKIYSQCFPQGAVMFSRTRALYNRNITEITLLRWPRGVRGYNSLGSCTWQYVEVDSQTFLRATVQTSPCNNDNEEFPCESLLTTIWECWRNFVSVWPRRVISICYLKSNAPRYHVTPPHICPNSTVCPRLCLRLPRVASRNMCWSTSHNREKHLLFFLGQGCHRYHIKARWAEQSGPETDTRITPNVSNWLTGRKWMNTRKWRTAASALVTCSNS